jgi:hypothetical protein
MLRGDVTNTNNTVFGLTQAGFELTKYLTRGEHHENHYTKDVFYFFPSIFFISVYFVSFRFHFVDFVSFRFDFVDFVSFRFVFVDFVSFRFVSFLFRFAFYRCPTLTCNISLSIHLIIQEFSQSFMYLN